MSHASATVTKYSSVFQLPASRELVFAAMTEPAQLMKWFAESVQIEPRVGGRFRFWGKRTPWVPSESDADGVITKFESPAQVNFRWTLRGCPSDTDWLIAEDDEKSELMVRHSATGVLWPRNEDAPWVLADFWKLMIGNLRHYLATGTPSLWADFSQKSGEVILSIDINAPAEKVWEALTNPEKMNQWLSKAAVVDQVVGKEYSYGWTDALGKPLGPSMLIDAVPNRLLVHDWHYADEPNTRVRWRLESLPGGGTRVTITHTKFDDPVTNGGYAQGWAAYLIALRELLERK